MSTVGASALASLVLPAQAQAGGAVGVVMAPGQAKAGKGPAEIGDFGEALAGVLAQAGLAAVAQAPGIQTKVDAPEGEAAPDVLPATAAVAPQVDAVPAGSTETAETVPQGPPASAGAPEQSKGSKLALAPGEGPPTITLPQAASEKARPKAAAPPSAPAETAPEAVTEEAPEPQGEAHKASAALGEAPTPQAEPAFARRAERNAAKTAAVPAPVALPSSAPVDATLIEEAALAAPAPPLKTQAELGAEAPPPQLIAQAVAVETAPGRVRAPGPQNKPDKAAEHAARFAERGTPAEAALEGPAADALAARPANGLKPPPPLETPDDAAPELEVAAKAAEQAKTPELTAQVQTAPTIDTAKAAGAQTVPHLAAQIAAKLTGKGDGKVSRFDVELDPAGMGKVEVKIEINRRGEVSASMSFDNPQAAAEMRSRAGELTRALEQAGFDLAKGGLSFEMGGQGGRMAEQGFDDQPNWRGRAFVDLSDAPAIETPVPAQRALDVGRVDVRV